MAWDIPFQWSWYSCLFLVPVGPASPGAFQECHILILDDPSVGMYHFPHFLSSRSLFFSSLSLLASLPGASRPLLKLYRASCLPTSLRGDKKHIALSASHFQD